MPTPPQSDNEGDQDDAEKDEGEEQMKDQGAALQDQSQEESKKASKKPPGQAHLDEEEKIFDRVIKVKPKTKLKGIRRQILEELGVQDICTARIFMVKSAMDEPIEDEEEHKDEGQEKEDGGQA